MSQDNVEVVRRAYELWNLGDFDAAAELLDPEVSWILPPNFPDSGGWHGRDAVKRGIEDITASWEQLLIEVQELIDAGDRVVALARFHGRATLTGLDLESMNVDGHLWTLRNGRAVEVRMYNGTEDALRAIGR